jgi:hypothetical protein
LIFATPCPNLPRCTCIAWLSYDISTLAIFVFLPRIEPGTSIQLHRGLFIRGEFRKLLELSEDLIHGVGLLRKLAKQMLQLWHAGLSAIRNMTLLAGISQMKQVEGAEVGL